MPIKDLIAKVYAELAGEEISIQISKKTPETGNIANVEESDFLIKKSIKDTLSMNELLLGWTASKHYLSDLTN